MIEWATEEEVAKFAHFDFRLLRKSDFPEFSRAYNESIESQSHFFDLGYFDQIRPLAVLQRHFVKQVRDKEFDMFGIFDGPILLGVGSYYFLPYSDNGCQITIWIRSGYSGKGIGTYFLRRLTSRALYEKGMHIAELVIDSQNTASRRMAEKVGYELLDINKTYTQGKLGSGEYCRYVCFSAVLETLALNYHKQPMDLIDHPALDKNYLYLIHNEQLNENLKWPYPTLIQRHYEGAPFGLVLEKLREQEGAPVNRNLKLNIPKPKLIKAQKFVSWRAEHY